MKLCNHALYEGGIWIATCDQPKHHQGDHENHQPGLAPLIWADRPKHPPIRFDVSRRLA